MSETIRPRQILTDVQKREVRAALVLAGMTQQDFADKKKISFFRLNRMLNGTEVVSPSYAKHLNSLIRAHLAHYTHQAA